MDDTKGAVNLDATQPVSKPVAQPGRSDRLFEMPDSPPVKTPPPKGGKPRIRVAERSQLNPEAR